MTGRSSRDGFEAWLDPSNFDENRQPDRTDSKETLRRGRSRDGKDDLKAGGRFVTAAGQGIRPRHWPEACGWRKGRAGLRFRREPGFALRDRRCRGGAAGCHFRLRRSRPMPRASGLSDVLVNVAGFGAPRHDPSIVRRRMGLFLPTSTSSPCNRMIGTFSLPGMLRACGGSGSSSFTSSISPRGPVVDPRPRPTDMSMGPPRAAVIGPSTKAVALDFVSRGVRCNAILPWYGPLPPSWEGARRGTGQADRRQGQG